MTKRHIRLTFVIAAVVILPALLPPHAVADPCSRLKAPPSAEPTPPDSAKAPGILERLWRTIWSSNGKTPPAAGEARLTAVELLWKGFTGDFWPRTAPDAPLHFTVQSGFSTTLECQADGSVVPQAGLYYPIGLVVQPLGPAIILGRDRLQLVEAEHGLLMYLDPQHLKPLEDGREYFFANSHNPVPYCVGRSSCRPDPRNVVTATARYGVSRPNSPGIATAATHPAPPCSPREIELFDRGGKLQSGRQPFYLTPCDPAVGPGSDGRIKVVSRAEYVKLFASSVRGSYHRFSDSLVSRLFATKATTTKGCGETRISESDASGTAKTEATASVYIVKLSGSAEVRKLEKWVSEKGPTMHIAFSTYLLGRSDAPETYSMIALAVCDKEKTYPEKGHLLSIRHPRLGADEISITQARVTARYATVSVQGLAPASTTALRRGQFWEIKGADQYFLLKDAIYQEIIVLSEEIREVFGAAEVARATDFFTHLVMAATVRFVPQGRP